MVTVILQDNDMKRFGDGISLACNLNKYLDKACYSTVYYVSYSHLFVCIRLHHWLFEVWSVKCGQAKITVSSATTNMSMLWYYSVCGSACATLRLAYWPVCSGPAECRLQSDSRSRTWYANIAFIILCRFSHLQVNYYYYI